MSSLNALNGTTTTSRPEGFDPQARPTLESLRCQWCLFPYAAPYESSGVRSVCQWCAGERADSRAHWCERGSHFHYLDYTHYNRADNTWDCGLCYNRAFRRDNDGDECMEGVDLGAPGSEGTGTSTPSTDGSGDDAAGGQETAGAAPTGQSS